MGSNKGRTAKKSVRHQRAGGDCHVLEIVYRHMGQYIEKWNDTSYLSSSGDDHCDDGENTFIQICRLQAWFLPVGLFKERNESMAVGGRNGAHRGT